MLHLQPATWALAGGADAAAAMTAGAPATEEDTAAARTAGAPATEEDAAAARAAGAPVPCLELDQRFAMN